MVNETGSSQPGGATMKRPTFEKLNTNLNVGAAFDGDLKKTLEELALKAQEKNKDITVASMLEDFQKTLKENVTFEEVEKYLKEKKVQNAAIVEGFLAFFMGAIGKSDEVSISEYLKDRVVDSKTALNTMYYELRAKILGESMAALADIKKQVTSQKLPEAPTAQV